MASMMPAPMRTPHPSDTCEAYFVDGLLSQDMPQRSCSDCLNVLLPSGQECALSRDGLCRPYNSPSATDVADIFRSSETKYCTVNDAACQACATSSVSNAACIGDNGCVCLKSCEALPPVLAMPSTTAPARVTTTPAIRRATTPAPTPGSTGSSDAISDRALMVGMTVAMIIGCMGVVALVALCMNCLLITHRERRLRDLRARQRQSMQRKAVNPLMLEGWHTMRQSLIQDESLMPGGPRLSQLLDPGVPIVVTAYAHNGSNDAIDA